MKEILRSLRNKNNYSQSAVASYLDISRQMYNKYENGSAEPSIKNIKKLCELYNVSADIFFRENTKNDITYDLDCEKDHYFLESLSASYSYKSPETNSKNNSNLFDYLVNLIQNLRFTEQITLMTKLASLIEKQTCSQESCSAKTPVDIKPKKLKKIPDSEYNQYFNSDESKTISKSRLANIREILKNDEW